MTWSFQEKQEPLLAGVLANVSGNGLLGGRDARRFSLMGKPNSRAEVPSRTNLGGGAREGRR